MFGVRGDSFKKRFIVGVDLARKLEDVYLTALQASRLTEVSAEADVSSQNALKHVFPSLHAVHRTTTEKKLHSGETPRQKATNSKAVQSVCLRQHKQRRLVTCRSSFARQRAT